MIANYHTHTARCNHAVGTEEEYVRAGIAAGLKVLGFSDHTPYPFADGCYASIRMRPEELPEYAAAVLALREKYAGQIQLPLGVEIEYFPGFWKEQLSFLRDHGVEYLLLGQHWSEYEPGGYYNGRGTDSEELLARYCGCVRDGMQTGVITYIAHPDLFYFKGSDQVYAKHMSGLCREARQCNIPLEINLLGLRSARNYPDRRFWELAAGEGCRVVLGNDSHAPDALLDTEAVTAAKTMVKELGLALLETVPLQSF